MKIGRYDIIEKIGEGGMGTVCRAKMSTLNKVVALKVLSDFCSKDPVLVERFMREARIMADLPDYGHVVQVFDLDERDGKYFYAMEHIPMSLAEYIGDTDTCTDQTRKVKRESKVIAVETAVDISCQILRGLRVIHEAGVVHRDLSPQNILVKRDGGKITAKITDFGIAGVRGSSLTKTGTSGIGKEIYVAPEQWESLGDSNERADLYSLGILMYRMVTGKLSLGRIKEPMVLNPLVAKGLNDTILTATEPEPGDRFQNAVEMLEAVKEGARAGQTRAGRAKAVKTDSKSGDAKPARRPAIINDFAMVFEWIPPGMFMMGSNVDSEKLARRYGGKAEWYEDENPRHQVTISNGFYLQQTQVTVELWQIFVKETGYRSQAETNGGAYTCHDNEWRMTKDVYWANPGFPQTDRHPVTCISVIDALNFVIWLNEMEEREYRLPTEAEWEYAVRAGSDTEFFWGNDVSKICEYGNVADRSLARARGLSERALIECEDGYAYTAPVRNFLPNEFGLYDMVGNVREWCSDFYGRYTVGHLKDPVGPEDGEYLVVRGGSWDDYARSCRSGNRDRYLPYFRTGSLGFCLVRS